MTASRAGIYIGIAVGLATLAGLASAATVTPGQLRAEVQASEIRQGLSVDGKIRDFDLKQQEINRQMVETDRRLQQTLGSIEVNVAEIRGILDPRFHPPAQPVPKAP